MKNLFKELFFRLLQKIPLSRDRASILTYHSVSNREDHFSAVLPEAFSQQMAYLAAKRQKVISLAELLRRVRVREPLGGSVILTFDDGYRDTYATAFSFLKEYGFPATIFVATDLIGRPGYCTVEELQEMHASGLIAIGSHTLTHPKLAILPCAEAEREIRESRRVLQDILGAPPTLFAYPYGNFSEETVHLVGDAGFGGAVTVREGTVGPDADPLRLPRNSIDRSTTPAQFSGKVARTIDWYVSLKAALRI